MAPYLGSQLQHMFSVYVLQSESTSKLHIGQTQDVDRRLGEHHQGLARYTRGRGPWLLVHQEDHRTRSEAMRQERFLKSGQGRERLQGQLRHRAGPPEAD